MYLKRIEIKGFKSFADPIIFSLSSGVTAFVGPNGCGKSNVIDAIRWAFGGRARSIRGSKMEDVLFTGNTTKPPANHAEVALVFNNRDKKLDLPFEEVSIKREINQDAISKYSLNEEVCKAGDIKKLFDGMGVGAHSYAIIEQGKIGQILMANSDERRIIFEEAAGITVTLERIRATRESLESTLQKLELVNVETERLKKETKKLEEQAKKAQKWKEYKQELREKQILLGRGRWKLYQERQIEARQKINEIQQERLKIDEGWSSLQTQLQQTELNVQQIREIYAQKDRQVLEFGFELEQQQKLIQHQSNRVDELNEEISQKMEQNIHLKQQVQVEDQEFTDIQKNSNAFQQELTTAKNQVEEQSGQLEDIHDRYQEVSSKLEESRQERFEDERKIAELRNQKTAVGTNIQNIRVQLQRLEQQLAQKAEEKEQLQTQLTQHQGKRDQLLIQRDRQSQLLIEIKKKQEEQIHLQNQQKEQEQKLLETIYRIQSRLEMLLKLEEAHEGYQDGVVALQKKNLEGFQGLLLQSISLKESLEPALVKALDSFLQEKVQYAIFQYEQNAVQALDFLKQNKQGRAHLVHQEGCLQAKHNLVAPQGEGVLGLLPHFLNYTLPGLHLLFADVLIVRDRQTALNWIKNWSGEILTLDGEVFRSPGVFSGGKNPREGLGLISRKTEIEHLEKEYAQKIQTQHSLKQSLSQIQIELTQHNQSFETQQKIFQTLEQELRDIQKDFDLAQQSHKRFQQEYQHWNSERSGLKISLSGLEQQGEDLEEQIDINAEEISERETQVQQEEFELKQIQTVRDRQNESYNQSQIVFAQIQEKHKNRQTILNHRQTTLTEKKNRLVQNEKDITALEEKIRIAIQTIETARTTIQSYTQKREDGHQELGSTKTNLVQNEQELNQFLETKEKLAQKKQSLEEIYHQAAMQDQEQQIKLDELYQRFLEEEIDPSELEKTAPAEPIGKKTEEDALSETTIVVSEILVLDFKTLESEIQELKKKISKIGNINLDSLQELEQTSHQLTQQLNQQGDCLSAKTDIEKMLQDLENESRTRFRETFEAVRKNFKEIFEVLFNGGYADIELEEGKDELTAGIQILAKPPGKSPRNLNLLSGGEKTMTTIALLFAIFRSKPSPFCILDEVDAALDEENIERFVKMLVHQFVDQCQFIIITHRKPTMRIANTLYGITMQTAGISTRITVDLENIETLLTEEPTPSQ
ncbi:MAG: chromosome segregation protein SMC [Planctomycetota bacterium]